MDREIEQQEDVLQLSPRRTNDEHNNVNFGASWPKTIITTIIFLHSGYVFLSRFGIDLTFVKKID